MSYQCKRVDVDEVRRLMGDKMADRIITAMLRAKARQVRPVTPEQIALAQEYVRGNDTGHTARAAASAVAVKYVCEVPQSRRSFLMWSSKLLSNAKGGRRAKAKK